MKIQSKNLVINGAEGDIEAVLDLPEIINHQYVSVNCHPHSLHGGTMTNKVVHTVSRSIAGLGIPSMRFNFRGVGKSHGEYDDGIGEQEDLLSVVNWMNEQYPNAQLILSGFSFGSFVSAFAAKNIEPSMLISVAPPVKRFDFSGFVKPNGNWQVIMGTEDELVDFNEVIKWVNSFNPKPNLYAMDGASHFFHGKLLDLRAHIESIVLTHVEQ